MIALRKYFQELPWYGWIFAPVYLLFLMMVVIPGEVLSLFSILYFSLFPDRHLHVWDCEGNEHQHRRLDQWRFQYQRCSLSRRMVRAFTGRRRRQMIRQVGLMFSCGGKTG